MTFDIFAIGVDSEAARLRSELREFKRAQARKMRLAARLVKAEEVRVLGSGSPLRSHTKPKREAAGIGPLVKRVRFSVRQTDLDVIARIGFGPKGFYGPLQETGLDVDTKGRTVGHVQRRVGGREFRLRGKPYHFHLPARATLEPTSRRTEDQVLSVMGDSYEVFFGGA